MRHTDQHMQKLSTTGPPLMPVQRSDPGPKSCPAAAVDPYHAGQTDGKRASCFAREAKPPAHRAAHESRLIRCQQKEPVKSAAADHLLGPALHGRSGRVSKRCGASRAGSWGGRRWATRPSAAMASTSPFIQTAARSAAYTARRRQNGGSMLTLCAHLSARAARGRLTWAWRTRWSPASRERRQHRAARPTSTFLSLQWSFLLIEAVIHDNLWPSRTPWAPGG